VLFRDTFFDLLGLALSHVWILPSFYSVHLTIVSAFFFLRSGFFFYFFHGRFSQLFLTVVPSGQVFFIRLLLAILRFYPPSQNS